MVSLSHGSGAMEIIVKKKMTYLTFGSFGVIKCLNLQQATCSKIWNFGSCYFFIKCQLKNPKALHQTIINEVLATSPPSNFPQ
jgi:hypothetical protein